MKFIPFVSVGEFSFDNSIEEVINMLQEEFIEGVREELDKKYISLYLPKRKIFIVFDENANSIRTIEVESDIFLQKMNLFKEDFEEIKDFIKNNDEEYNEENGQIESKKYGIIVEKKTNNTNLLTFYSKKYLQEEHISPDDIIKYYLE